MNWKQLYASSQQHERDETLISLLVAAESIQKKNKPQRGLFFRSGQVRSGQVRSGIWELYKMILTRREKHFLLIAAIIAASFLIIPEHHKDTWETILLYVFAFPIGLYVVTDPERSKKEEK